MNMKTKLKTTKKGAASFYMVAFSTLILIIIVTSFAAVVISEVTRTANDDLSQSAYDSALAGVEDAKVAIKNYQNCLSQGADAIAPNGDGGLSCNEIVWYMENPDCDMVGRIVGRIADGEDGHGVPIQESNAASNNMEQAYTCAEISKAGDYRSTLSASNSTKIVQAKFGNTAADKVSKVKISWYADAEDQKFNFTNFVTGQGVVFPTESNEKVSAPPTISFSMLQTAETFTISDFKSTKDGRTDRGTLFLVPTSEKDLNTVDDKDNLNYISAQNSDGTNSIGRDGFLKSNDKTAKNRPYAVYCPLNSGQEFVCSVTIDIPDPIGGSRNPDTFFFSVSLPYGNPATDFALEFMCDGEDGCSSETIVSDTGEEETVVTNVASLDGVQIKVDSTGRANDMYRRVETRLEPEFNYPMSLMGPLVLLGDGDQDLLDKNYATTCEWNEEFGGPTC